MGNEYLVLAVCKEDGCFEWLYKYGNTKEEAVEWLHDDYIVRTVFTMEQVAALKAAYENDTLLDFVNENYKWFDSDDTMDYVLHTEISAW